YEGRESKPIRIRQDWRRVDHDEVEAFAQTYHQCSDGPPRQQIVGMFSWPCRGNNCQVLDVARWKHDLIEGCRAFQILLKADFRKQLETRSDRGHPQIGVNQ